MDNATPSSSHERPTREEIIRKAKEDGDLCVWEKIKRYHPNHQPDGKLRSRHPDGKLRSRHPDGKLRSRDLFTYALVLWEAHEDLGRLQKLFDVAGRMQDRNSESPTYGNFRWHWEDKGVNDPNAVEFCLRGLAPWAVGLHDILNRPDEQEQETMSRNLRTILDLGTMACWVRWAREMYTNISLMNAMDLILLGIALDRPDVADEGYSRLDRFYMYIWDWGIHEYCSPTYTGIDLCCLGMIERFCGGQMVHDLYRARAAQAQAQARALQKLFWTDVALNRLSSSQRMGGAHSRKLGTYRPHRETADLDTMMWLVGWLPGPAYPPQKMNMIYPWLAVEKQDEEFRNFLKDLKEESDRFPRLVRQAWGHTAYQANTSGAQATISRAGASRTHYLCRDITLSTASAAYDYPDTEDLPLTVDFPGSWRCYFISDPGTRRNRLKNPYNYAHNPPLLWAAAQRKGDALGVVLYPCREGGVTPLESHFVMPWSKEAWVGGRPIDVTEQKVIDLQPGEALVRREGTAAVGVRVIWAQTLKNRRAPVQFRYQEVDKKHNGMRLTVSHQPDGSDSDEPRTNAGAALWVRIGSGLKTEEAFRAWREAFAKAEVEKVQMVDAPQDGDEKVRIVDSLCVEVAGTEGRVSVKAVATGSMEAGAAKSWLSVPTIEPAVSLAGLELNGKEVGRPLLVGVEPIKSYEAELYKKPLVDVPLPPPGKSAVERSWLSVKSGRMWYPMEVRHTGICGEYIWLSHPPHNPAASRNESVRYGSDVGSMTWHLNILRAGTYYMWAHIRDESYFMGPLGAEKGPVSFLIRIFQKSEKPLYLGTWFPGEPLLFQQALTPIALMEFGQSGPTPLELPQGNVKLQIWARI